MGPTAMTLVLSCFLVLFTWSAIRRWKLMQIGGSEPRSEPTLGSIGERIRDLLIYVFGQKKMLYYPLSGYAHVAIFFGFLVLLLRSVMLWSRGYDPYFDFWGILSLEHPIGIFYNIAKDIFIVAVVIGASVFLYLRLVTREKRMTLSGEGLLILFIIISMMLADILYDGATLLLDKERSGQVVAFSIVEPAGSIAALLLYPGRLNHGWLTALQHIGFWGHSVLVLTFLNILPYSKHFHVITVIPNVFLRREGPAGKLDTVTDLEGKVEREEPIGRARIENLSWKNILDLYTCTECGRCSDNCPAYNTEKKLSPKHVILAQRGHLYQSESRLVVSENVNREEGQATESLQNDKSEMPHSNAPPGAYFRSSEAVDIVPDIIHPDVIWACTTCRACEEQCPVLIDHVQGFIDMRRHKVMVEGDFPSELAKPFNGIETNSNPWNLSSMDRAAWSKGLDIPLLSDNPDAETLFFVGCAASFDDRAKKTAVALCRLFKLAGVNFAILGNEEGCCGDPARRAGNEYLFQMQAQQNIDTFNPYKLDQKTIVTACPHGFNTLKNEYPDFGGTYRVIHHSDFLLDLIQQGKLSPSKPVNAKVAYHDSCYLGRYNNIYDAPRKLLASVPGVQLVEPKYWSRNRSMCCGAGGAQMFMEEQGEKRVNYLRTKQLLDAGADAIATACPFCMTMLTDGLKSENKEDEIGQWDILEVLSRAIEWDR
ncbi:MAG: (Fe-S)-binding protein [Deltaproteobacteria bacterium]|nr:(Fe-S)-binding protein [Deltaproteobacteria bacterium]